LNITAVLSDQKNPFVFNDTTGMNRLKGMK